jgi:hypothetical protein
MNNGDSVDCRDVCARLRVHSPPSSKRSGDVLIPGGTNGPLIMVARNQRMVRAYGRWPQNGQSVICGPCPLSLIHGSDFMLLPAVERDPEQQ